MVNRRILEQFDEEDLNIIIEAAYKALSYEDTVEELEISLERAEEIKKKLIGDPEP